MPNHNSLTKIEELKAQIAKLEGEALQELRAKRESLLKELAAVDAQLAELTGEPTAQPGSRAAKTPGRSVSLQELKELLDRAPDKTLNTRKEGLDLANIKTLVAGNPELLKLGGKSPWPTVTLLK